MGEGSTQGWISRFFFWLNVEVHSCGLAVRSLVEFLWLVESCRLGALSISSSLHALLYHRSLLIERDSSTVLFSRMASGETKCLTCIFFLLCCLSPPPPNLHTSCLLLFYFFIFNLLFLLFHFKYFTFPHPHFLISLCLPVPLYLHLVLLLLLYLHLFLSLSFFFCPPLLSRAACLSLQDGAVHP